MTEMVKELTETEIRELVKSVVQNPAQYPKEAQYILVLELRGRKAGCGYTYLYGRDIVPLLGDVDIVTLERSEFNCNVQERVAIIPRTVPAVVLITEWDETPGVPNYVAIYVFGAEGWRYTKVRVPDASSAKQLLAELRE